MTNMFIGGARTAAVPFDAPVQHGAPRLQVLVEKAGPVTRLCLRGTLDTASAATAYDTIVACAATPARQIHVDLNGLEAATRAGCRAIHVAAKLVQRRSGRTTIFGARANVAQVLKNNGFDALFEFCDGTAPPAVASPSIPAPRL